MRPNSAVGDRRRPRARRSRPDQVQQVSYGQVIQAGQGQIPSRQAQISGGILKEVPSETVNKVCARHAGCRPDRPGAIRAGDIGCSVAGMESMSLAPYLLPGAVRFPHG